MKRLVATAAMMVGLLGVMMAPAHADPINAPNAQPLELTCENGATYDVVVVPGRGNWTPALVTDSNQVIVPFSFDITVTNADTGEVVFHETTTKEPVNRVDTTTCQWTETFEEDGQTFEFVGIVEVLTRLLG
jgi:hypothetical protein